MNLDEKIRKVSIVGAAGKMGSGIALLLADQMAKEKLNPKNKDLAYRLNLIDVNDDALDGLVKYLKTQLVKAGEKSAVVLRELYKDRLDLIENFDIVNQFVEDAASLVRCSTDLNLAKGSTMVFEAVLEDKDLKVDLLKKLDKICGKDVVYLTNTSSIPIHILNKEANLDGRIIGFHFYNPPAVQRLAELICAKETKPELKDLALELAKRLRKKTVPSNDIAGFIGNGHFLRDGLYGIREAKRLSKELGLAGGIYAVNKVSQDLLVRPMGIFQLIDYVGVDVFHCISETVSQYLKGEDLKDDLLAKMVQKKVLGGQRSDGTQKDGFLKYEKNRPVGVYDIEKGEYKMFDSNAWAKEIDKKLGDYPQGFFAWKALLVDPKKDEKLSTYFKNLNSSSSLGAKLASSYLKNSKEIGKKLVGGGVAASEKDVNDVLLNGFYHLYGPINDYVK
ncbi:MAG: 3-hydroxyacyl-CoA dehydrogenase family protein [candidate division Zixibacteria bacterium]|nr:3-hydroxyacyl-CoA dehydrogenase family protein [candidate division Zixibacteria bacterium]